MVKEFLMRQVLSRELGKAGIPKAEQDKMIDMIIKHPELFQKIAEEAKQKIDGGMPQMQAMQEVMQAHKQELEGLTS
jgi:hypothetical protein